MGLNYAIKYTLQEVPYKQELNSFPILSSIFSFSWNQIKQHMSIYFWHFNIKNSNMVCKKHSRMYTVMQKNHKSQNLKTKAKMVQFIAAYHQT